MSEQFIKKAAELFGLEVMKRITTGTEASGFATFELTGTASAVMRAADFMRPNFRRNFDGIAYPTNPDHPDKGKPYILCESVWFDNK